MSETASKTPSSGRDWKESSIPSDTTEPSNQLYLVRSQDTVRLCTHSVRYQANGRSEQNATDNEHSLHGPRCLHSDSDCVKYSRNSQAASAADFIVLDHDILTNARILHLPHLVMKVFARQPKSVPTIRMDEKTLLVVGDKYMVSPPSSLTPYSLIKSCDPSTPLRYPES